VTSDERQPGRRKQQKRAKRTGQARDDDGTVRARRAAVAAAYLNGRGGSARTAAGACDAGPAIGQCEADDEGGEQEQGQSSRTMVEGQPPR